MRKNARWFTGPSLGLLSFAVLLVVASPAVTAAELPTVQVNECNSNITIAISPVSATEPTPGQTVNVLLTIASTDARDDMDNPVAQVFDKARYGGDCASFLPCIGNNPSNVMFLGNVGGTCPGVVANPLGDGIVEFDFVPDLSLTVTGAAPPFTPASCTITFDVSYAAPGVNLVEANTGGVCQNPSVPPGTFDSDTTVTTVLEVMPPAPFCGDGNLDPGEECDDGNNLDGDGCSAMCTIESVPTLPEWGMLLMALALLSIGVLALRSRRREA